MRNIFIPSQLRGLYIVYHLLTTLDILAACNDVGPQHVWTSVRESHRCKLGNVRFGLLQRC